MKLLPLQLRAQTYAVLASFFYNKPNFPPFSFSFAVVSMSLSLGDQDKIPHFGRMAALKGLILHSTTSCTSFFYFSRAAPSRCRCHNTYCTTHILLCCLELTECDSQPCGSRATALQSWGPRFCSLFPCFFINNRWQFYQLSVCGSSEFGSDAHSSCHSMTTQHREAAST